MGSSPDHVVRPGQLLDQIGPLQKRSDEAHLNEELISPPIQGFEALAGVDVVHQNTTVCSSVERHT